MSAFKKGQKAEGKFSKNDMPPKLGPGDNPEAPAESYARVTYEQLRESGPLPRGRKG
jgi:hypothetical protein